MKIGFGLSMQQSQRLMMTPELRQALRILQLPAVELREYIEDELLQNPVLETKDDATDATEDESEAAGDAGGEDWTEYFHDGTDLGLPTGGVATRSQSELGFEAFYAEAPTLQEHLLAQLQVAELDDALRPVAEFLIGNLDDNGLLTIGLDEVAERFKLQPGDVWQALQVVQGFDPAGVGARNLQECLLLQWETLGKTNPLVPLLIRDHLADLAEGRLSRVAAALGVSPSEVQEAVDLLKTLDPKPGRRFGHPSDIRYVVPDLMVERVGGDYVIIINDAPIPRLAISLQYRKMLRSTEGETRKFLEARLHSAVWLLKSIEQRRLTLYRVMDSIVKRQRAFFEHGVRHLRPMTLREVADMVGVHESTVSRAVAGKYAQTPQGVFELRFFFSRGVEAQPGTGVSAESIKRLMRDLIAGEDSRQPLSDQALADRLRRQGVPISRRTVAKYREEMGLASSAKRKRYD